MSESRELLEAHKEMLIKNIIEVLQTYGGGLSMNQIDEILESVKDTLHNSSIKF